MVKLRARKSTNPVFKALLWIFVVRGFGALFAQQTQPTPADTKGQPGVFTLQTGTNLVVVDVVVLGLDGRPVKGLKASDFSLSEDHQPQHIRNFQEHPSSPSGPAAAPPRLAPGLFTNYTTASNDGPANVLLLDMLNTPLRDQAFVKMQIQDYLKRAPAGTNIAILGLSSKLFILQGFTSDMTILKAALNSKKATGASSLLDDPTGGGGGDGGGATSLSDSETSRRM
jgi:VWFA-related protein